MSVMLLFNGNLALEDKKETRRKEEGPKVTWDENQSQPNIIHDLQPKTKMLTEKEKGSVNPQQAHPS